MEDCRLKGEIDDSISFENYMNKITEIFNIEIEKLISYKHDELENTYQVYVFNNSPGKHDPTNYQKDDIIF